VALPKDPHSGGSGSSPEAPGSGHPPEPDGGPPPPPGFGVNLLAAIHRQLLVDQQNKSEGLGISVDPGPGDPLPAGPAPIGGTDPGNETGAGTGTARPFPLDSGVLGRPRRLRQATKAATRRVAGSSTPATVKAKLRTLAKAAGLPCLPGAGSLTLAARKLSRDNVLQYITLAASDGDPHCQTFLHVYQDLKAWEKKCATLDDVCAAAGISPVRLLKAIVGAAYEAGVDVANMVASVAHPDVVQKGVEYAMEKDGIEDRRMLYQHHSFIPMPKGTTINVSAMSGSVAQAQAAGSDQSVPSFLEDVDATIDAKETVQKFLTEGEPEPPAA